MPTAYENPTKKGTFLPTLAEVVATKKPDSVPTEASWMWGADDEIGRLNLLTAEHVAHVMATEPKYGQVVSLNWDMRLPEKPGFGRQAHQLEIVKLHVDLVANDDILHMNVQSGSQIDGLRHVGHQACQCFYNGVTDRDIFDPTHKNLRCGMQAASQHGIVGRGVLLDWASWAQRTGRFGDVDVFSRHPISLAELQEVARVQGVRFERGDILLVRTGWMQRYHQCLAEGDEPNLARVADHAPTAIGLDQSDEIKTWLHDQYFSLVGGDQPAFEAWPGPQHPILHELLLACWGVMIGEMLDLEELAVQCREKGKYSFVFTSAPLNSPGGVATLANALCIL